MKKCLIIIGIIILIIPLYLFFNKALHTSHEWVGNSTLKTEAMDTVMEMTLYSYSSKKHKEQDLLCDMEDEINRLDDLFSVGNDKSEVSILNNKKKNVVSKDSLTVLALANEINAITDGAFDITVFPLMEEWGFTTKNYNVPDDTTIKKLLHYIGMQNVDIDEKTGEVNLANDCKIDLGGIAKGYASDQVIKMAEKSNIHGAIVSLGGNVQTYGTKENGKKFKVGIENPYNAAEQIGILTITNKAIITSGGYKRFFEKNGKIYHHIIDPKTGYPAESDIKSVTVISDSGAVGDALSTALYVLGKDKAIKFWRKYRDKYKFDIIIMDNNKKITITKGIKKQFQSDARFKVIE